MAALASPLLVSALPLQVATFSLRGPDPTKIQLLIHAAIGADYSASRVVSFGYVISDREGRIVESLGGDARLPPVMNGVPSPLQYNVGASLPPGEYTLKLAVVEGDRVGTIEHEIHAALVEAPPVKLSELMVGGPSVVRQLDQPTIGHTCRVRRRARICRGLRHRFQRAEGEIRSRRRPRLAGAPDRRRDGSNGRRRAHDLLARARGPPAAAGTVRAPRHRLVRSRPRQDDDARLRGRGTQGAHDVGRERGPERARAAGGVPARRRRDVRSRVPAGGCGAPRHDQRVPGTGGARDREAHSISPSRRWRPGTTRRPRPPSSRWRPATATAARSSRIWRRPSRRPATTSRRRAPGRPRSSTAAIFPRSTSGWATRSCASAISGRRA